MSLKLRRFLFEWEDQPWFPASIRGYMLDFLTFFLKLGQLYNPIALLLVQKLQNCKAKTLFDLASGGAGPLESLLPQLAEKFPEIRVFLSDLYPNPASWRRLERRFPQQVKGVESPVNASHLPPEKDVVFTMFSALHHFEEAMLTGMLTHMAAQRQPALFCDGGGNRLALLSGIVLMPFLFFFATPFLRPLSLRRVLFTYLLPVVPVCTLWDGTVSILRLYSFATLQRLAAAGSTPDYQWKAGKVAKFPGVYVYYLEGTPLM